MSSQLARSATPASSIAPGVIARRASEHETAENRTASDGGLTTTGSVLHFVQDREIYGEGDEAEFFLAMAVVRSMDFTSLAICSASRPARITGFPPRRCATAR
jgi:hypothetical protein